MEVENQKPQYYKEFASSPTQRYCPPPPNTHMRTKYGRWGGHSNQLELKTEQPPQGYPQTSRWSTQVR